MKKQTRIQAESLEMGDPIKIKDSSGKIRSGTFMAVDNSQLLYQAEGSLTIIAMPLASIETLRKIESSNTEKLSRMKTILATCVFIAAIVMIIEFSKISLGD